MRIKYTDFVKHWDELNDVGIKIISCKEMPHVNKINALCEKYFFGEITLEVCVRSLLFIKKNLKKDIILKLIPDELRCGCSLVYDVIANNNDYITCNSSMLYRAIKEIHEEHKNGNYDALITIHKNESIKEKVANMFNQFKSIEFLVSNAKYYSDTIEKKINELFLINNATHKLIEEKKN